VAGATEFATQLFAGGLAASANDVESLGAAQDRHEPCPG
jgi:hypothetical protein